MATTDTRTAEGAPVSAPPPGTVVHVRYFAAAAEAAGTSAEEIALPPGATAADLLAAVRAAHGPGVDRVLEISSLLVDGATREDRGAPLGAGPAPVRVDVLPPFAGG